MVFSIYMVIEYCRTAHPVDMIRDYTHPLSTDEIKDILTIRPMGWALDENDLEELSAITSPLIFRLDEYERSPSAETLYGKIEHQLENDLPPITVVDAIQLQEDREDRQIAVDEEQEEHAVVVVGMDDHHVYINDPWGKAREQFKRDVFADAWDVGLNRIVTTALQSTLGSHGGEK